MITTFSPFVILSAIFIAMIGVYVIVFRPRFFFKQRKRLSAGHDVISVRSLYPAIVVAVVGIIFVLPFFTTDTANVIWTFYAVVTGVMLISAWFVVRDITAGVIVRSEKNIKAGDHIRFNTFTGRIKRVGLRCLVIKKDENTEVIIPYSAVASGVIEKVSLSQTADPYTFTLDVQKDNDISVQMERIRQAALCCAWISLEREPQVERTKDANGKPVFNVTVYPILPNYGMKIENALNMAEKNTS